MISHSEMAPTTASLARPTSFHKALLQTASDGSEHDIATFLSRPVIVRAGTWTNAQNANAEIDSVKIPLDVMTASKVFVQKLSGFLGFRAKTVLRLQVNTNRFQQGRLMMTYFPAVDIAQAKHSSVQTSLRMRTQLPRVDFNAATDSEVIFEVPYISPNVAFNCGDGSGKSGHVGLVVYDPLNSASSELSAQYTIWAHFEDVELLFPSVPQTGILPQAGNGRGRRFRVGDRNPTEVEAEETGFLSKALGRVSKASTILSEIPILSSIAGPVGWASAIGARAATALGFSNPLISQQVQQFALRPWMRGPNYNGGDASYSLGFSEDSGIETMPGFAGQDLDEMALMYPLSIWTWHQTVTWSDTVLTYGSLVTIPCQPTAMAGAGPGTNSATNTPVSYFSNLFSYYRGSFKIKLKFVKTEFHSGRLMVCFNPRAPGVTTPTIDNSNASYMHREVVDIREITEYEFVAPFASTRPYLSVDQAYGDVAILVLNELRHPDTVLSSVNVLVEVACCDDWEFAGPRTPAAFPFFTANSSTAQSGNERGREFRGEAQGETSEDQTVVSATVSETPKALGTAQVLHDGLAAARFCMGDRILSLRQLVKRATYFGQTGTAGPAGKAITAYPWLLKIPTWITVPNFTGYYFKDGSGAAVYPDMVDWVAGCYGFFRGSMRFKIQVNDTNRNAFGRFAIDSDAENVGFGYRANTTSNNMLHSGIPYDSGTQSCPEVNIPYYNSTFMSNVVTDCGFVGYSNVTAVPSVNRPKYQLVSDKHTSDATSYIFYRQAGDDFHCGFWTGAPFTANSSAMAGKVPTGP